MKVRKIRLGRSWAISIFFALLMGAFPWIGQGAVAAQADNGNIHYPPAPETDPWWTVTPWETYTSKDDSVTGSWGIGLSYKAIKYRDAAQIPPPGYKGYFGEICLPWITMNWNTHGLIKYDHSTNSMNGHLLYICATVIEQNDPTGKENTTISAQYYLDPDGCGVPDFKFIEEFQLYGKDGYDGRGCVVPLLHVKSYPSANVNGVPTPFALAWNGGAVDTVQYMEVAWRIDGDVFDTTINKLQTHTNNPDSWHTTQKEGSAPDNPANYVNDGGRRQVKIRNDGADRQASISATADGHSTAWFYLLRVHGNEYSQWPSAYITNEDCPDQNVLLWWVAQYTSVKGFPSVGNNYDAQIELSNIRGPPPG